MLSGVVSFCARQDASKVRYAKHLSAEAMEDGLRSGALLRGALSVRRLRGEAYVRCDAALLAGAVARMRRERAAPMASALRGDGRVLISSEQLRNRSIHGDTVAVRLLPEEQWRVPRNDVAPVDEDEHAEEVCA